MIHPPQAYKWLLTSRWRSRRKRHVKKYLKKWYATIGGMSWMLKQLYATESICRLVYAANPVLAVFEKENE